MRDLNDRIIRRLGWIAIAAGILGLLYWPFYASAYFATPDGAESAEPAWVAAWHEPFREAVGPMLTFAEPHDVYVTYGKALNLVLVGFLAGFVAFHAWQRQGAGRFERATFRLAFTATALLTLASVFLYWMPEPYWTRFVDYAFMGLAMPGFLLCIIGYPLYGWATLRARVAPRTVGWLFVVGAFPGIILLTTLTGSLAGGLIGLDVAWIAAGIALVRAHSTQPTLERTRATAKTT